MEITIIDDNISWTTVLGIYINNFMTDTTIKTYYDYDSAINDIKNMSNNVIICDYHIGSKTGDGIIREIIKNISYIIIIVVSGETNKNVIKKCIDSGADYYIIKNDVDVFKRICNCIKQ